MAGRCHDSVRYDYDECCIPCVLSDGRSDRAALSGLWHDTFPVLSSDRQNRAVRPDAPDGHTGCRYYALLSVEQIYRGKTRERNEVSDCNINPFVCHLILRADVLLFPRQRTLCLYER